MGLWQDITGVTAANAAADAQLEMNQQGIAEQRRQFEIAQGNMALLDLRGKGMLTIAFTTCSIT